MRPARRSAPHAAAPREAYPSAQGLATSHVPAAAGVTAAAGRALMSSAIGAKAIAKAMWPATAAWLALKPSAHGAAVIAVTTVAARTGRGSRWRARGRWSI